MSIPEIDCTKCSVEMVCVAIGANLLLPVAPSIMGRFLNGIDVDASTIIKKKFAGVKKHIDDADLTKIGELAVAIAARKSVCDRAPGLLWRILDVCFAAFGVFLLWSGWAKNATFAPWSPVLLLPVAVAAAWPFLCFLKTILHLKFVIWWARIKAKHKKAKADKAKQLTSNTKIADFVTVAKAAIEESSE